MTRPISLYQYELTIRHGRKNLGARIWSERRPLLTSSNIGIIYVLEIYAENQPKTALI